MSSILIITVGTRDVSIDKANLEALASQEEISTFYHPKGNTLLARPVGQFLLKNIVALKSNIKLPLIEPCFKFLKGNNKFEQPSKVILIVTDQNTEGFSLNDTINYGKILSKLIPERFGNNLVIEQLVVVKDNLTFLDNMYDWFRIAFEKEPFAQLNTYDSTFLLNVGGIDAINFALLFHCIRYVGSKLIHLTVSERTQDCLTLDFSQQFMEESEKEKLLEFLKQYDYGAINTLNVNNNIKLLALYAQARLHFDFETARLHCQNLDRNVRRLQSDLLQKVNEVTENDEDAMIKELYHNAIIKVRQHSYVDFLLRAFRITEHIAKTEVLKIINLPYEQFSLDKFAKTIKPFVNEPTNNGLENYLKGRKIDYERANIKVFVSILEYYNHRAMPMMKAIQSLSQMRNSSIGAHDFKPVSLSLIEEKLKSHHTTLEQLLDEIRQYLGCDKNPFDELNSEIQKIYNQ